MKRFGILLVAFLCLGLVSGVAWGQETIIDEELRDGQLPDGWSEVDIVFETGAGGYARFTTIDALITTPVIDLTGYTNVQLTFDVAKWGGGDDGPLTVEISDDGGNTWDAQMFDSPTPPDSDYLTSGPTDITVTGDQVQIRWIRENSPSEKRLRDITLTGDLEGVVATPTFDPPAGTYYNPIDVEISTATENATIFYSFDSDEGPWSEYTDPLAIDQDTTIWAYAEADDLDDSGVAEATYTIEDVVEVADIATLREGAQDGTVYRLTGEAILTFQSASRNAKYIQDASAAILIDDAPGTITTEYDIYDGITNITGTLSEFQDMLQFVPVTDPGDATSINNVVEPEVISLADITDDHQAMLIQVYDVEFDATGNFDSGQTYNISDPSGDGSFRTQYFDVTI